MMWIEVNDDAAIDKLMNEFGGFHDSCIVSISYSSGAYVDENGAMGDGSADEHKISMIVHSQWANAVELCFSGVKKCGITGFRESYFCNLYDATLEFRTDLLGKTRDDRLIVWADHSGFDPLTHTERYPLDNGYETTFIIAEKLKYRFWSKEAHTNETSFPDSSGQLWRGRDARRG